MNRYELILNKNTTIGTCSMILVNLKLYKSVHTIKIQYLFVLNMYVYVCVCVCACVRVCVYMYMWMQLCISMFWYKYE